jgi:F-type H+-transporting ATPase subunit a
VTRIHLTPIILLFANSLCSAEEGVSVTAQRLKVFGDLPITNSMVTSWVVSVVLILLVRWLVGKPSLIPTRGQLIIEECIGMLRGIIQPIVGRKVFFPSFWLLSGLFFFILVNNISGLFPGVGTIGYGQNHQGHFSITEAWIRPGNADLNMTLALAAVANLTWLYLIFKYAGLKVIIKDWFGNKADKKELNAGMFYFLGVIFIAVGFIEVISIIFRPVSLTFRLFGNVFGGESLLHSMFHLGEKLDFPEWLSNLSMVIVPIPFYMLEVLIGVVQALVFMLLVSVYIGLICNHGDEEHH